MCVYIFDGVKNKNRGKTRKDGLCWPEEFDWEPVVIHYRAKGKKEKDFFDKKKTLDIDDTAKHSNRYIYTRVSLFEYIYSSLDR